MYRHTLRPRWTLCLLVIAGCCAAASSAFAADRLLVEGTLTGIFMAPEGELVTREIPMTAHALSSGGEALHPLWGWYYLRAEIVAARPIQAITILSEGGTVVWREELDEPQRRWTIPRDSEETSVAVHPPRGLQFSLQIDHPDGSSSSVPIGPTGIKLLPEPPRIDWRVVRQVIAVRSLLRERGDEALSGFRADEIAFAINGEEQMLLIDHPAPPPDFQRYDGPQPIDAVLHIGPADPDVPSLAWATMIGGVPTAVYHGPLMRVAPDELDPDAEPYSGKYTALIHEACHCAWPRLRMVGDAISDLSAEAPRLSSLESRLLTALQREALEQAASAPEEEAAAHIRDYLALHDTLMSRDAAAATCDAALEGLRTTEGFAQFATETIDPHGVRVVDMEHPEGYEMPLLDRMVRKVNQDASESPESATSFQPLAQYHHPHHIGLAQATALMRLNEDAMQEAWAQDRLLIEQLAREVGYDRLTDDERQALISEALTRSDYEGRLTATRAEMREGEAQLLSQLRAAREGAEGSIEVRFRFSLPAPEEPAGDLGWNGPQFFTALVLASREGKIAVGRPCLVRAERSADRLVFEVRTALASDAALAVARRRGDAMALQCGGAMLSLPDPAIAIDGQLVTVTARLPETLVPRNALPLAQALRADGGCFVVADCTTDGPIDPDHIPVYSMDTTITGVFRGWPCLSYETRSLIPTQHSSGVRLEVGETYRWDVDIRAHRRRNLHALELLAEGETCEGSILQGGARARASMEVTPLSRIDLNTIHGRFEQDDEGRATWRMTLVQEDLRVIVTGKEYRPFETEQYLETPLLGATVRVWPIGHEELAQTQTTDEEGVAVFEDIPASMAVVEVTHPETCGTRAEYPTKGWWGGISVFRHCGMRCNIEWRGEGAPEELPVVEVTAPDGESVPVELQEQAEPRRGYSRAFDYTTPSVRAGDYTVTVRWGEHEMTETATVRNDCQYWFRHNERVTLVEGTEGPHQPARGAHFRFPPRD